LCDAVTVVLTNRFKLSSFLTIIPGIGGGGKSRGLLTYLLLLPASTVSEHDFARFRPIKFEMILLRP